MVKLYDSELKVMEVLWREGDVEAKRVASVLNGEVGWNVNTTYTLIKRCIKKGSLSSGGSRVLSAMRSSPKSRCSGRRPTNC